MHLGVDSGSLVMHNLDTVGTEIRTSVTKSLSSEPLHNNRLLYALGPFYQACFYCCGLGATDLLRNAVSLY